MKVIPAAVAIFICALTTSGIAIAQKSTGADVDLDAPVPQISNASDFSKATNELADLTTSEVGLQEQVSKGQRETKHQTDAAELIKGAETNAKKDKEKLSQDWAAYKAKWATLNAQISEHNSRCPNGAKLPKAQHETCHAEFLRLHPQETPRNTERLALDRRQKDMDIYVKGLAERRNQSTTDTLKNFQVYKAAMYKLTRVQTRISALKQQIAAYQKACREAASNEEIKLKCGNVQFDGADSKLAPLPERGLGQGSPKMR